MTKEEIFEIWAPLSQTWALWAKPVLFAEMPPPSCSVESGAVVAPFPVEWLPVGTSAAIVIDLPGATSVTAGIALARHGYRPVPLFNAATAPNEVVDQRSLIEALVGTAPELERLNIRPSAPPAFLLDSRRQSGCSARSPGRFDNRWIVFPQDFPSARFLLARQITSAVVVQSAEGQPAEDLAHVLRRWQEAGINLSQAVPDQRMLSPLHVRQPSRFFALYHRVLATMGFRRHGGGGFGATIPYPSSGGGSGLG